jgi:hypothetical protein
MFYVGVSYTDVEELVWRTFGADVGLTLDFIKLSSCVGIVAEDDRAAWT